MIIAVQTLVYFRQSLLAAIERVLQPYYKRLTLVFNRNGEEIDEEDSDDQVFSDFDDEKGVIFYPPVYAQRYAAVSDCLMDERWQGKLEKVVDFGYHDMSFIKYLKDVPGIQQILGVDLESIPLRCSSDVFDDYTPRRESPLHIILFQGNAADPDYRLIGCDAVIAIEMIEHMLPHDLDRFVHTVFGFIKPWIVVFTTPNGDFNALFKALEKNGLRRLDHFFEWSREQFNDWCSNIVTRYPLYTVTCKGIGPGPPGTLHYGCCSQLALFINKDYHKQQDLNLNSLALVSRQSPKPLNDIYDSWNSSIQDIETIHSPTGLNCSTFQVKKFSKTTQNLMAKNKMDSLMHTREVVDEIRHLTKALNFNKCIMNPSDGTDIWCNINWGENAPYWNQYYKIVREYNCPFETKSQECRILELVSDEINRIIDMQFDEDVSCETNRVEIPLSHLMAVVEHITDDVDKVRDILEWNGYEIVNDVVIHSRLVVDAVSVDTHEDDWQDNETFSDWDNVTEVQSTTMSESSTVALEYHDLRLRRALDHKVRNLRTMLTADEDITTELDKVVCKLMKLALRSSRERTAAPPAKWMQCKLLDLLTLTEKAIERRKKCYVEDSLKAIEFRAIDNKLQHIADLHNINEDIVTNQIMDKYRHIISPSDITIDHQTEYQYAENKDELHNTSNNALLEEYENFRGRSHSSINVPITSSVIAIDAITEKICVEPVRSWLKVGVELIPYPKQELDNDNFGDTETVLSPSLNPTQDMGTKEIKKEIYNASSSELLINKCKSKQEKKKKNNSTRVIKKVARKIFGNCSLVRHPSSKYRIDSDSYITRSKRRSKENRCLTMCASKPIPESLIDLCHPELKIRKNSKAFNISTNINKINDIEIINQSNKATTENRSRIDMNINNKQETLYECKSSGTHLDVKAEPSNCIFDYQEQAELLCNEIDLNLFTKHEVSTENIDAQTIFLNDINEPSTSKGIRHNISMDVQCGPDTLAAYPMLSTSTSSVRSPLAFSAGLKILDVAIPVKVDRVEFGTSTQDIINDNVTTTRSNSTGIRIKDSDTIIYNITVNTPPMTQNSSQATNLTNKSWNVSLESTEANTENQVVLFKEAVIETPSAMLEINDSSSIPYVNPDCVSKSVNISPNSTKDVGDKYTINFTELLTNNSKAEESKPVLSCGGVHVHSYKDKQQCEDIVYQGEWQRFRPEIIKKKMHNSIVAKKINESCKKVSDILKEKRMVSKEKLINNRAQKTENMVAVKKPLLMRKAKQDPISYEVNKVRPLVSKSVKCPNTKRLLKTVNNVTKVASKISISSMSSKNVKSAFTAIKPQLSSAIKRQSKSQQNRRYKPKNTEKQDTQTSHKSKFKRVESTTANSNKNIDKITSSKSNSPIARLKTKKITENLLDFSGVGPKNTIIVCRNDKQEDSTQEDSPVNPSSKKNLQKENIRYTRRAFSPPSLNSSTCSSPNSIATVRAMKSKNQSYRTYSSSSYNTCCTTSESDNSTPSKEKRVLKRYKSNSNKENIPTTTENCASKQNEESDKSLYLGHQNNVCIAKINNECLSLQTAPGTLLKQRTLNKSHIEITAPENFVVKDLSVRASLSRKISSKTNSSLINSGIMQSQDIKSDDSLQYGSSTVLVVQPQEKLIGHQKSLDIMANTDTSNLLVDCLLTANYDNEVKKSFDIIKQLVEDIVDGVDFSNVGYCGAQHSRIVTTYDDVQANIVDLNESSTSFKTITADSFSSDFESPLSHKFDKLKITDQTDLMDMKFKAPSFKAVTLITNQSQYFLADSELDAAVAPIEQTQTSARAFVQSSITDIFERKEHHLIEVPPGLISIQAFSELSLDREPATGDQPDPVSLIDSETGSLAVDVARLTASEELLISGRSSDSYESCLLDEDAVVPNWLFQIINHQQSVEDEQPPVFGPQPEPIPQPVYDLNGNPIDPGVMGVTQGAGDGRGIHSDPSQDSSGRGTTTSISSNETSTSSAQSEDIVMDPSTFTPQYESLRDIVDGLVVTTVEANFDSPLAEGSRSLEDTEAPYMMGHTHRSIQPVLNPLSDVDGDVSSLDTDVPDSSEN